MLNIIQLCISHNKRIALPVKYLSCEIENSVNVSLRLKMALGSYYLVPLF